MMSNYAHTEQLALKQRRLHLLELQSAALLLEIEDLKREIGQLTQQRRTPMNASAALIGHADNAERAVLHNSISTKKRYIQALQLQEARGAASLSSTLELEQSAQAIATSQRALVAIDQDLLARVEQLAAGQPVDATLRAYSAELRAELLDTSIELKRAELNKLEQRLSIQTRQSDHTRLSATIEAQKAELEILLQQRQAL